MLLRTGHPSKFINIAKLVVCDVRHDTVSISSDVLLTPDEENVLYFKIKGPYRHKKVDFSNRAQRLPELIVQEQNNYIGT